MQGKVASPDAYGHLADFDYSPNHFRMAAVRMRERRSVAGNVGIHAYAEWRGVLCRDGRCAGGGHCSRKLVAGSP